MKTHDVRPATLADVHWLAPRLRRADVAEIRAASGQTPLAALEEAYWRSSTCMAVEIRGELVCLYGAAPTDDPMVGSAWMLGSDGIERHAMRFLRECRRYFNQLHDSYDLLYNLVDARNLLHLRWLKWAGVSFINRHEQHGHEGRSFLEFVHIRKSNDHNV